MNCLVTGSAGFIGSNLCEELLKRNYSVKGIDAFIPYYDTSIKKNNLECFIKNPNYIHHSVDLRYDPLEPIIKDVEYIYHLAAMPGLTKSWTNFEDYWTCNVLATKKILEAVKKSTHNLKSFVYVSTSSVYGKYSVGNETIPTSPVSPYGITKLAGEHICNAYKENFHIPITILRYFSVYGPRQRPDMAYFKFIQALLNNKEITIFGNGKQIRGNTFVQDCINATIHANEMQLSDTFNVGGKEKTSLWDVIHILEKLIGCKAKIKHLKQKKGDQIETFANTKKLYSKINWQPEVSLEQGLKKQIEWQKSLTPI
jgi:nucleoside-diphosphate-sugar epimerase